MGARFLHGFCTVGVIHVRLCRALYCIAISALFLHQVSRAKRSFAFISGSASFSNSKRAVMEMVGSPAAGKCKTDQTYLYRFGLFCHKIRTEKDSEKAGAVGKNENQKG